MLRSELGLSYREVLYEISLVNLKILSNCTPNFNYKSKQGIRTTSTGNNMPEFGAKGNAGGFDGMMNFFRGIKAK